MKEPILGRPKWWQWPTVLSLDAPTVALLWQWQLARAAGTSLRPPRAFILGAAVWLVYAADRWIEGWRLAPGIIRTQRHYFYHRLRWPVALAWAIVAAAGLAAALIGLSRREVAAGLCLLAPVLAYLLSHQLVHRNSPWRPPKELCVGLLFGAGVAFFAVASPGARIASVAGPTVLFMLLCFSNCALISVWETAVDQSHGQMSLVRQYRGGATFSRALPWVLAGIAALWGARAVETARAAFVCVCASGVLLAALDAGERRIGRELARVLADVALMTPAVPLIAGHWR